MRMSNLLQLTEHHRFAVVRRFGLSPLDMRMLWSAYQPIVGGFAASLYATLANALPSDQVGVGDAAALGQLFLVTGLEPNEKGRKRLVEETSKLEAVGLLQTIRLLDGDEVALYEFRLSPPLAPGAFFGVHHLWLLLQEKLGSAAADAVRRSFVKEGFGEAPGERSEDISSPFYEVFRMRVPTSEAIEEAAPTLASEPAGDDFGRDGFRSGELLSRCPKTSSNRRAVERLVADASKLAELNYIVGKFNLSLKQTVTLMDEDGMFGLDGVWSAERFQARAADMYRQSNASERSKDVTARKQELARTPSSETEDAASGTKPEREVTQPYWLEVPEQFQGQCDVRQYNALLANSPYTRVLKLFFQPSAVPAAVEEAFLAMNVNYQLPDEVINVMIHYIRVNDLDWKRKYLDAIGANVAGKRIRSFENAVVYFRKAEQGRTGGRATNAGGAAAGSGAAGSAGGEGAARPSSGARRGRPPGPSKPVIPVARSEGKPEATEEDIKRIMERAKRLNNG
ncbi:helicase DnaB [Paenibacillus sp. TRM 82003]|nr:helicase DnaB [Paenibacillus sp. TRM 82003]